MQPQVTTATLVRIGWRSGICDCFQDADNCCDVYWCHICAVARQWDAVEGKPNNMHWGVFWLNLCCGLTPFINCLVRCTIARRFAIDESQCESCWCGTWCGPCTTCQQHRELTSRGYWPGYTCCGTMPQMYRGPAAHVPMIIAYQAPPQLAGAPPPLYDPAGPVVQQGYVVAIHHDQQQQQAITMGQQASQLDVSNEV